MNSRRRVQHEGWPGARYVPLRWGDRTVEATILDHTPPHPGFSMPPDWLLAVFDCPKCGHPMSIIAQHHTMTLDADGQVTFSPSVVCPHSGCGWHVFVRHGVAS